MSSRADVDVFLKNVAAFPRETQLPAIDSVGDAGFSRALQTARATSLTGQMLVAVRSGRVKLSAHQMDRLREHHRRAMVHALRTEHGLLTATSALRASGIRHCALKGLALAHTCYADPADRTFSDADLLVEPGRLADAVGVLRGIGWQRVLPEVRPGFDNRFSKDVPLHRDGVAIDLHRTLISGPFGVRVDTSGQLDRARVIPIGTYALPVPDAVDAYLHAALTAGAADVPPRLVTLTDMIMLEDGLGFDPAEVIRRAERSSIGAPVARGVVVLHETLRLTQPPTLLEWARQRELTRSDRVLLNAYLRAGRSYRRTLASIVTQETWRDRIDLSRSVLVPSASYRRARAWSFKEHLARALRSLLR